MQYYTRENNWLTTWQYSFFRDILGNLSLAKVTWKLKQQIELLINITEKKDGGNKLIHAIIIKLWVSLGVCWVPAQQRNCLRQSWIFGKTDTVCNALYILCCFLDFTVKRGVQRLGELRTMLGELKEAGISQERVGRLTQLDRLA